MPAKSVAQQQAAGQALAAKRGEIPVSDLKGAAKDMYDSMSEKELKKYAETDHAGLPGKVEEAGAVLDRGLMQTAEKRGADAAKKGKRRAPLMDPKFVKMVPHNEPGATSPYFKAWLKGFDMQRAKNESKQLAAVRKIIREEVRRVLTENDLQWDVESALKGLKDAAGKPVRYSVEVKKRGRNGQIQVWIYGAVE